MITDISNLEFDPMTGLTDRLLSRLSKVTDILSQQPFGKQQQRIATTLSDTVFNSLVSLPPEYKGSTHESHAHDGHDHESHAHDEHDHDNESHTHDEHDHESQNHDEHDHESHTHDGHIYERHTYKSQNHDGHDHDGHDHGKSDAFTTVGSNGQRINNGQNFTASPLKWTRTDGLSDGRNATVVTFAFDNEFDVNGISTNEAKSLFVDALETWSSYSPLDFEQQEDPGSGNLVDILVQSASEDGPGNTLAFAFFPTVGDITFDRDENWNTNTFLETSVHEIGHALGLDHENDTDAIMNSVLRNRYTNGTAFLFEDDIQGIQSLYGSGRGSVQTLANDTTTATPPPTSAPQAAINLVTNGSFEDVPLAVGEVGRYSEISGWSLISGTAFQVDRRPASSGQAADGTAWVELDVYGTNSTFGQNVDTVTGESYNVSVEFSDGGRAENTTSVHVFWEGQQIDTLSGGGKGQWRRFDYTLTGGARSVSTLAFRAIGPNDSVGGFIDNVVVTSASNLVAADAFEANEETYLSASLGSHTTTDLNSAPMGESHSHLEIDSTLILPAPTEGSLV
ncbi:MAG: matrixin family metalloprotease [Phormidesmis sp.]